MIKEDSQHMCLEDAWQATHAQHVSNFKHFISMYYMCNTSAILNILLACITCPTRQQF
jgi:hypothetical protein